MIPVTAGSIVKIPVILVDSTDFVTRETGIVAPTITISINGAALGAPSDGTWAELAGGAYTVQLNATDTATAGYIFGRVVAVGCYDAFFLVWVRDNTEKDIYDDMPGLVDTALSLTHGAGSWEDAGAAAPTVEEIDAQLTSTHGADSWQTGSCRYPGAGAGAVEFTYHLTEPPEVSGTSIPDADVWVTETDDPDSAILASGRTDSFGNVTFMLDPGPAYFWRQKSGWNFTNPDTETVEPA